MNENITPLPWFAYKDGLIYASTEEGEPCVAVTKHDPKAFYALSLNADECAANTAYIVEACNAYPTLTARVKELEEKAAALVRYCDHFKDHGVTREFWLRNFHNVQHVEDLRSALNKEPTT